MKLFNAHHANERRQQIQRPFTHFNTSNAHPYSQRTHINGRNWRESSSWETVELDALWLYHSPYRILCCLYIIRNFNKNDYFVALQTVHYIYYYILVLFFCYLRSFGPNAAELVTIHLNGSVFIGCTVIHNNNIIQCEPHCMGSMLQNPNTHTHNELSLCGCFSDVSVALVFLSLFRFFTSETYLSPLFPLVLSKTVQIEKLVVVADFDCILLNRTNFVYYNLHRFVYLLRLSSPLFAIYRISFVKFECGWVRTTRESSSLGVKMMELMCRSIRMCPEHASKLHISTECWTNGKLTLLLVREMLTISPKLCAQRIQLHFSLSPFDRQLIYSSFTWNGVKQ